MGLFAGKLSLWLLGAGLLSGLSLFAQQTVHPADVNAESNDKIRPLNSMGRYSLPAYPFSHTSSFTFQPAKRSPASNNPNFSSLDTCATYTYRLKIGNPGSVETVHDIRIISSGNMLLAGKTLVAGDHQSLLIKLDADGRLIWSKSYGGAGTDEEFRIARETADGGIITIGASNTNPVGDGWLLICKMDNAGNLQWTRRFQNPLAGTAIQGADIVEMEDQNFLFTGDNGVNILFGKLTSGGTVTWNRSVTPFQTAKALSILEDYNGHFITVTGTESGFSVASIFKVSLTDGSFVWGKKFGGAAVNTNFIFHHVEMINLRPRITGIWAPVGQPWQFMRATVNTGSNIERVDGYTITGPAATPTAYSSCTPWSETLAFITAQGTNGFLLTKNSTENFNVEWSKTISTPAPVTLVGVERTADAGFITASNMSGDIYLVKTDSIGANPGCAINAVNTVRSTVVPNIPNINFTISNQSWLTNTSTTGANPELLDTVYYCRQLTCPVQPPEDTCLTTFRKRYRSYAYCDVPTSGMETGDDNLLFGGITRPNAYDASTNLSYVVKMDKRGNLLQKELWQIGDYTTIHKQVKMPDGNTLVSGYARVNGGSYGIFLTKIDAGLNTIWTKFYRMTIANSWQFSDVTVTAEGDIFLYLLYLDFPALNDRIAITKFDGNGNLVWQNTYRTSSGNSIFGYSGNIVSDATHLYCNAPINISNQWRSLIFKIDKASGTVSWSKVYVYNNQTTQFNRGMRISNGSLFLSGELQYSTNESATALMKVLPDGLLDKTVMHRNANHSFYHKLTMAGNGDLLCLEKTVDYGANPAIISDYFVRLNPDLTIRHSKKRLSTTYSTPRVLFEGQEGNVYANGLNSYTDPYSADFNVTKYAANGEVGTCVSDSFAFEELVINTVSSNIGFSQFTTTALQLQPIPFTKAPYTLQQNEIHCASVAGCDTLWLDGPLRICRTDSNYVYRIRKTPGCTLPTSLSFAGPPVTIIENTDSLVRVRFLASGDVIARINLYTGCRWLRDSILIESRLAPSTLDLGSDFDLCPGNTRVLNAHQGFQTYRWQDGSNDSVFTVTTPGLYWVETTDACNTIKRDSILISPGPPVSLDLGPDLSKCNSDSLSLSAPAGFTRFEWSPAYNISSLTAQTVQVFPAIDTSYMLKAEKTPGCFAYDTVRISVRNSPPINLGPDKSFCSGDSLLLDAGVGFTSYNWNHGPITRQITVRQPGSYMVQATAPNGCMSLDTLVVPNVYTNPLVNLGADSPVCQGEIKQLSVPAGFVSYLWSTGSTAMTINASTQGNYWLTVTDNRNCKGRDTLAITAILPLPSHFLPPDTSLCAYSTLLLSPQGSFNRYNWSTGALTRTITIADPGQYSLEVMNNSGCRGRDTIIVLPKQCQEGFYIPSGFTPNNDGKNDRFRPFLFGAVEQYAFSIYNRWGERIFHSTQVQQGWDGNVGGLATDSNVFIWQCTFKFKDQPLEFRKGTVVLIR